MSNLPRILGAVAGAAVLATTTWIVLEDRMPRSDQSPAFTRPGLDIPYPTPDLGGGVLPGPTPEPLPETALPTNRKLLEDEVAQLLSRLDRIGRVADSVLAQNTPPDAATSAEQVMQRFDRLDAERTRISERLSALGRQREALVAAEAAVTPPGALARPDAGTDADETADSATGQQTRKADADLPEDAVALEQQRTALNLRVEALNLALSDLLRQSVEPGASADERVPENSLRLFERLGQERSLLLQRLATTNQRLTRLNEAAIPLPPPSPAAPPPAPAATPTPDELVPAGRAPSVLAPVLVAPVPAPPAPRALVPLPSAPKAPDPSPPRRRDNTVTTTASPPAQPEINLRCRAIVQRAQLGEDLTYEERGYLQRGCSGRAARP